MSEAKKCRSELVAESKFSSITVCPDCNLYHLHIGPMSFRLEAEIFESFCNMIVHFCLRHDARVEEQKPHTYKH